MCAGLIAAWVLMGWSGGQFPDSVPIALGGLGTSYFFAFFVAIPLLARWSRRRAPPVDGVFR